MRTKDWRETNTTGFGTSDTEAGYTGRISVDPIQPVDVSSFLIAAIAGAMVVMLGALYAGSFAFGRLYRNRWLIRLSYAFFVGLAISVTTLANALHLEGIWTMLVYVLLIGYLLAPRAIWRLSVGTHGEVDSPEFSGGTHHE
jgi:hypothetical protein